MLQLRTFRGLWLTGGDPRFDGREGLRRQLLLVAMVAESGDRGISRDRAIAFFWPDGDEERGRPSLDQLRYTLRRELGEDPLLGTQTLRADPSHLSSDVAEFASAMAHGDADRASALYTGLAKSDDASGALVVATEHDGQYAESWKHRRIRAWRRWWVASATNSG